MRPLVELEISWSAGPAANSEFASSNSKAPRVPCRAGRFGTGNDGTDAVRVFDDALDAGDEVVGCQSVSRRPPGTVKARLATVPP